MNILFIGYIETKKYGKIAHFIDASGNNIYSKIITKDDTVYYEELTKDELEEIRDELDK